MTKELSLGAIIYGNNITRRPDYLYRLSVKALILNNEGKVLVVKETGRDWWDLPGGGMDHRESIKEALAREVNEEVNLTGDFTYRIIDIDEPTYLPDLDIWQMRLIFKLAPEVMIFSPGVDGDEILFIDPEDFKDSKIKTERHIYEYVLSSKNLPTIRMD